MLDRYTAYLRQQPVLAALPFERWSEVIREARDWGLLSPDPDLPSFLRLQPILPYFLRNRLNTAEQVEVRKAIEIAFRQHYDQLSYELYQLLESKDPQERLAGQVIMELEYENLMTALNLALAAQVSILKFYTAMSFYLDRTQDQRRGLELGQTVLKRLEGYPPDKLAGAVGAEFGAVIDGIASRQLLLKQYKEAEASYRKALALWLENKSVNAETIKKVIAGTYHQLGMVAQEQRQWPQAEEYYQQALQIWIEYQDRYSQASTYHQLGAVAQEQRQWPQAEEYYQHALQIYIEYQDRYQQAGTYHQLGRVAEEQRKFQQARDYFLIALEAFAASNDTYSAGVVLGSLARLWQTSGDTSLPATLASALDMPPAEVETLLRQALGNEAEGGQTE